jgi:hypothetical protein
VPRLRRPIAGPFDTPVLSAVEGPVLSAAEGPVLSPPDEDQTARGSHLAAVPGSCSPPAPSARNRQPSDSRGKSLPFQLPVSH